MAKKKTTKKTAAKKTAKKTAKKATKRAPAKDGTRRGRDPGKVQKGRVIEPTKGSQVGKHGKEGRPPFEPTEEQRRQVETLVGYGMNHDQVCQLVLNPSTGNPISKATLHRYFKKELDAGVPKANSMVAQSLFRKAVSPDHPGAVTAAIFWLKARAGWSEKIEHEHSTKSGVLLVPSGMTAEQWMDEQDALNDERQSPIEGDE